jgi:hypothetical protein
MKNPDAGEGVRHSALVRQGTRSHTGHTAGTLIARSIRIAGEGGIPFFNGDIPDDCSS